jgi:hypothetical protein
VSTAPPVRPHLATRRARAVVGSLLAPLAVPIGVAGWLLIWQFGYMATLVGLGTAVIAVGLYRLGAGRAPGPITGWLIAAIVLVTLAAGAIAGHAVRMLPVYTRQRDLTVGQAVGTTDFWDAVLRALTVGDAVPIVAAAFGVGVVCAGVVIGRGIHADRATRWRDRLGQAG